MRGIVGKRDWWIAAAAATLATASICSAQGATQLLGSLVDGILRRGPDSQLPAHLTVVLGLSRLEQGMPVKQAVVHDGDTVRTFNVCIANHDNLVIMAYNERKQAMKAYLVSARGTLRKAVSYQAGSAVVERSPAEARSDYAAELKFWTDFSEKSLPPGSQ